MLKHTPRSRFEQSLLPHIDAAYNLARWLMRNDEDAKDAVQEAYLRAYRFFDGFRGDNPRAWLLTVVRNTCFSLRGTQAGIHHEEFDETSAEHDAAGQANGSTDPAAISQRGEDLAQLNAAIEALPLEFREVLVLRELEGCAYKEIAQIIGAPIGTVMSRLARARALVKGALTR